MAKKEDIRPIYAELQGYLSQAPPVDRDLGAADSERGIWEQVNQAIYELERITQEEYDRYKIVPNVDRDKYGTYSSVRNVTYRTKLGGLISRLHGKYFSDEVAPFSGMPSTVISQSQQQSQSFQVQLLLEIQSKIDEQLQKLKPGDKKRNFLEKVKGALKSVRNTVELVALILSTGKEFGLTVEELNKLFI